MPTERGRVNARGASLLVLVALVSTLAAVGLLATAPASADYETDCANPTAVFDEATMPANLNVGATDVIVFSSGEFTGSANIAAGGIICVDTAAAFNPSSLNGTIRLFVRGEATFPPSAVGSGSSLDNEGSVTFLPQINVNGLAEVFNRTGATLTVEGSIALGPGVTAINDGTISVEGDANFDGTVTNNGTITNGGVLVLTGTMINNATVAVAGQTTLDSGATLVNLCRFTSNGMISNATIDNSGVIDLRPGDFLHNGAADMTQNASGIMLGDDFTSTGTITGSGQFSFSGVTSNQGVMAGSSPDAPLIFEDTSPTGDQILDVELGTITDVVRAPVAEPGPDDCGVLPPTTTTSSTSTTSTSTTSTSTTSTSTSSTSTTSTSTTSTSTTTTMPSTTSTSTTTTVPSTTSTTSGPTTSAETTTTVDPGPAPSPDDGSTTTAGPTPSGGGSGWSGGAGGSGSGPSVGSDRLPRTGAPLARWAAVGALLALSGLALGGAARQGLRRSD